MATATGNNRYEGDFGMPMLPGEPLGYTQGDYVRIAALELTSREIERLGVEGAAAELGVYRGSFARYINRFFPSRRIYLFDTFEGFDGRDVAGGEAAGLREAARDWSDTSPEAVLAVLPRPQNAVICKGRFPESAAGVEDEFCFVSLDADLYEPMSAGLRFFWQRLSKGGVIFAHDYNNSEYPGAARAVREFCESTGVCPVCLPDFCGTAVITKNRKDV